LATAPSMVRSTDILSLLRPGGTIIGAA